MIAGADLADHIQSELKKERFQIPSEGIIVTPRRTTCLSFVFAALLAVFGLQQGRADTVVDGNSVFNFEGACSDCTGVGLGVLTVQNYTEGSGFSNQQLHQLHIQFKPHIGFVYYAGYSE